MTLSDEEDARLGKGIEYFADRLHLVYAAFFAVDEYREHDAIKSGKLENYEDWKVMTIWNACLHSALVALRDVDDFLTGKKKWPDDMHASDYGYPSLAESLLGKHRTSINKRSAHLTWQGPPNATAPWQMLDLVTTVVDQGVHFMKWVEKHYGTQNFDVYSAALVAGKQTGEFLKIFSAQIARRKEKL